MLGAAYVALSVKFTGTGQIVLIDAVIIHEVQGKKMLSTTTLPPPLPSLPPSWPPSPHP